MVDTYVTSKSSDCILIPSKEKHNQIENLLLGIVVIFDFISGLAYPTMYLIVEYLLGKQLGPESVE